MDLADDNHLLAALPGADLQRLSRQLTAVALPRATVLHQPGDEIDHVYFPRDGVISLLVILKSGQLAETAAVGREGAVGLLAGFGLHAEMTRAVVLLPLRAWRIAASSLRKLVQDSAALRNMIVRGSASLLHEVQTDSACHALHPVLARLARRILQASDRSPDGRMPITQESLASLMGVRRGSINAGAGRLREAGLIRYGRGNIHIVDRAGLEAAACECYAAARERRLQRRTNGL